MNRHHSCAPQLLQAVDGPHSLVLHFLLFKDVCPYLNTLVLNGHVESEAQVLQQGLDSKAVSGHEVLKAAAWPLEFCQYRASLSWLCELSPAVNTEVMNMLRGLHSELYSFLLAIFACL